MIGARLKLVREILGKTQVEFAEMIRTTQSGVASMESGLYRPSGEFLSSIALKTGFTSAFFENETLADFPYGSILYRANLSVKAATRTQAHAITHAAFDLAMDLAGRLKRIRSNIPRLEERPEDSAKIARAALGLSPNTPIKGLIRCLEANGVIVFSVPLSVDGFDGFSNWAGRDPSTPVIALMRGKTAYREVFTCAEELAHLVLHHPLKTTPKNADKEARAFAQEFLLPSEAMLSEMHPEVTLTRLAALKGRWGVSMAFLAKRAESLRLVSNNRYRYLVQQMRSNWGAEQEPGDDAVQAERPRVVRKMAQMLYGDPIDIAKLSKESGLPNAILRQLLDAESQSGKVLEFRRS
jgi:Zn-dependent peptidase ImmA (M78 family)/DNA-binding XRE family transcriptional regulator